MIFIGVPESSSDHKVLSDWDIHAHDVGRHCKWLNPLLFLQKFLASIPDMLRWGCERPMTQNDHDPEVGL